MLSSFFLPFVSIIKTINNTYNLLWKSIFYRYSTAFAITLTAFLLYFQRPACPFQPYHPYAHRYFQALYQILYGRLCLNIVQFCASTDLFRPLLPCFFLCCFGLRSKTLRERSRDDDRGHACRQDPYKKSLPEHCLSSLCSATAIPADRLLYEGTVFLTPAETARRSLNISSLLICMIF